MSNYSATVVKLNGIKPHPNAARLQCVSIFGNNVIVGLDTKDGDVGLFFPVESQIGPEFCSVNDLIRRKDENGKPAGGMFDQNRRVRAQTLRGEKSVGFWCPISYLAKALNKPLEDVERDYPVGTEIETIGNITISTKYIPKNVGVVDGGKEKQPQELVEGQFHYHFNTAQLGKNIHNIHPSDIVSITWKLHGTSAVVSHCLVKKELKWYEKVLKKVGVPIIDTKYDYVFSSRKVIKGKSSNDIWTTVGESLRGKLHKGETLYMECVGFLENGSYIQKDYDYGCVPGQHKVYVYRITRTNVDGIVTELPWNQVVARCKEIGVDQVPEIRYGRAGDVFNYVNCDFSGEQEWQDTLLSDLMKYYVCDQDSQFCNNKVPEEGIVVRVENGLSITNYKLKSYKFLVGETKQLDDGITDIETEQSEAA